MRVKHITIAAILFALVPTAAACGSTTYAVGDCVTVTPGLGSSGDPGATSGDINGVDCPKTFDLSQQIYRVESVIHDEHGECRSVGTAIQFEDDPNGVVYCLSPAISP